MNSRAIGTSLGIIVLGFGGLLAYFESRIPETRPIRPVTLVSIENRPQSEIAAQPDLVTFSDGSQLQSFGYDVQLIGTIESPILSPLFLFKSANCRACEAALHLWIYNSNTKKAESFLYPGEHTVTEQNGLNEDEEYLDFTSQGVFGKCFKDHPGVFLIEKSREAQNEKWKYSSTSIQLGVQGELISLQSEEDRSDEIATMLKLPGCQGIEPEDRADYY